MPQVILWIELFANIGTQNINIYVEYAINVTVDRGVYAAVDPLFSGRFIFPFFAANIIPTISIPAYATTSLMITLYW